MLIELDVATIASLLAVIVSIGAVVVSVMTSRASDSLTVEVELFLEFRDQKFRQDRRVVIGDRTTQLPAKRFAELGKDVGPRAERVAHFYDHVGLLMKHRFIRRHAFRRFMGLSARLCWFALEPVVQAEREAREDHRHLYYFEYIGTRRIPRSWQPAWMLRAPEAERRPSR